MAQERLPVHKIREVLRLKEAGVSNRAIACAYKISNSTVGEYLRRAHQAGVSWSLPEQLDETGLYQKLFPEKRGVQRSHPSLAGLGGYSQRI